ncbi:hypothetical protein BH11ARM2_BH11ARM2_15400 [soil metagenome]
MGILALVDVQYFFRFCFALSPLKGYSVFRRAFTLIELLVVIAIIAILAAILFPVFAQAKAAAKGAASLSNTKQIALAGIMYGGDVDDQSHLPGTWNTPGDPVAFNGGTTVSTWAVLVLPYIKSGAIFEDPTSSPTPKLGNLSSTVASTFVPHYGYNYSTLSPQVDDGNGGVMSTSISLSSPAEPAGTVMYTSKFGYSDCPGFTTTGYWSFNPGAALWTTVEQPNCYTFETYCAANWGKSDGFVNDAGHEGVTDVEAGANSGGVSSHANGAAVAFVDGHSKKMKLSALAAGTNWTPDILADNVITTDETKYMWDAK